MDRIFGYLLAIVIVGLLAVGWVGNLHPEGKEVHLTGPDVIVIARPEVFGDLERPAVPFPHERHVDALQDEGCTACHDKDGGKLEIAFVDTNVGTGDDVMDEYHDRCTGCHIERASQDTPAGPQECGGCHVTGVAWLSSHGPAGLDLALHKRHVDAFGGEKKCEECHKIKAPEAPRAIYEMGSGLKDLPLMQAAHAACVGCHYDRSAKGEEKTGPVACSECHEKHAMPNPLTRPEGLPEDYRLLRDQEDHSIIYVGEELARLPEVPFDHAMHEGVASSCRTCHHNSLQACSKCHTLDGEEKGERVRLVTAYHDPLSIRSCVGCHREHTDSPACLGCHGKDPVEPISRKESCLICHHRGERPATSVDIPEHPTGKIKIDNEYPDEHVDRYGPAEFDHEEHLERMQKLVEEDTGQRLALRFHSGTQFLCTECHHHSPPIQEDTEPKPPRCTSCHRESRDLDNLGLPGAPAAYHQQCVGCHERMDVRKDGEPLGCGDCHTSHEEET